MFVRVDQTQYGYFNYYKIHKKFMNLRVWESIREMMEKEKKTQ